jgi:hypothetical protein
MNPMRRSPRTVAIFVGILSLSLVGTACGSGSAYDYVRDTNERTAFRLPRGWTTFDERTVMGETGAPQGDVADPIKWMVGIDADPYPSVRHILSGSDLSTDHPAGLAMVQELSFVERDAMSVAAMRNYFFPVDQLVQNESNAVVVSYDDEVLEGNLRGLHMVVSFRESVLPAAVAAAAGQDAQPVDSDALERSLLGGGAAPILTPGFVEFDQQTLVDASTHKVYSIILACSSECFQRDRGAIEDTIDSWTVSQ